MVCAALADNFPTTNLHPKSALQAPYGSSHPREFAGEELEDRKHILPPILFSLLLAGLVSLKETVALGPRSIVGFTVSLQLFSAP